MEGCPLQEVGVSWGPLWWYASTGRGYLRARARVQHACLDSALYRLVQ